VCASSSVVRPVPLTPAPPVPSGCRRAMSAPTAWRATLLKALKSNGALPNAKYVQLVCSGARGAAAFSHAARDTQATVRPSGRPANRTVVFRCEPPRLTAPAHAAASHRRRGALQGVSRRHGLPDVRHRRAQPEGAAASWLLRCVRCADGAASQVTEVAQSPYAEACWYLPQTREQFRLSGARRRALACAAVCLTACCVSGQLQVVGPQCTDASLLEVRLTRCN
jgi:hypothetical protein